MSWTDVFPVLDDAQVAEYEALATPEDRILLEQCCGVARVANPRSGPHLVATSLFWKPAHVAERDFPTPTRSLLKDAKRLGLVSRHAPWEHYVQPLLDGAEKLRKERPDIVFRVYLAADLEFLTEDLVAAGCEVMVMNRAIGKLIQTDSSHQIPAQLQTGRELGMQIMDQALLAAIQAKEIDPDDAVNYASDRKLFARFVTDPTLVPKLESAEG